jgi:hypothetical protein
VQSVENFNQTKMLKYDWPLFTEPGLCGNSSDTIMKDFFKDLCSRLSEEMVIESEVFGDEKYGELSSPQNLLLVSRIFTDGAKVPKPLLYSTENVSHFVNGKYDCEDALVILGVKKQTAKDFHERLKKRPTRWIWNQTATWHVRLAAAIIKKSPNRFKNLQIIPLREGNWISANDLPFYLPSSSNQVSIPKGITAKIICPKAANDPTRRKLYEKFGAKQLTSQEICLHILKEHCGFGLGTSIPIRDLVEQTRYLFKFRKDYRLPLGSLKLLSQDSSTLLTSNDLYLDCPGHSFVVSEYFANTGICHFLHSTYLKGLSGSSHSEWIKWLHEEVQVRKLPKLLANLPPRSQEVRLSKEFRYLIEEYAATTWLGLLQENWNTYATEVEKASDILRRAVVKLNGDDIYPKLNFAYLATPAVLEVPFVSDYLELIKASNAEWSSWSVLGRLGICSQPNLDLYLFILQKISKESREEVPNDALDKIYGGIEEHFKHNPREAR